MKIVFIYSGAENLGVEYLSSFLKSRGHEIHLLFDPAVFSGDSFINIKSISRIQSIDEKIVKAALQLKPDLIGFSSYTGNYQWCLHIARRIKETADIPIVFGGVHPTAVPGKVLSNSFVDFVIIGEGEYAILDLIGNLEKGHECESLLTVPNICFKYKGRVRVNSPRPYIQNLDVLPFPDKMLFYDKVPMLEKQYFITTSRGCPYNCTYCSNNMYQRLYCVGVEKNHVRRRSPDNVIEELAIFAQRGKVKLVSFVDDVFTFSQSWLEEFIPKYKSRIGLPFFCNVHPLAVTESKARLLKEGGCCLVTMGVQSGSEKIRTSVFHRRGDNDRICKSVAHIKSAGIKISVDNIFGAPTETEEDLLASLALYSKIKPDRIMTFWLTYYPKTSIIDQSLSEGRLSAQDVDSIEEGHSGYAHGTGSVTKAQAQIYSKYELAFHTCSLVHNKQLFWLLSRIFAYMPYKRMVTKLIILVNGLVNRDLKVFYVLNYVWTSKNVP